MSPYLAEFIGTTVLIYLGNGVNANVSLKKTYGNESGWLVISLAWGLAVFIGVVIAGPFSGGHLNPAVSVGLAVAGKFSWSSVPGYILAQTLGAIMGAFLVFIQYKDHFKATIDSSTKLGVFATAPAIKNNFNNLLSEMYRYVGFWSFLSHRWRGYRFSKCLARWIAGDCYRIVFGRFYGLCHQPCSRFGTSDFSCTDDR